MWQNILKCTWSTHYKINAKNKNFFLSKFWFEKRGSILLGLCAQPWTARDSKVTDIYLCVKLQVLAAASMMMAVSGIDSHAVSLKHTNDLEVRTASIVRAINWGNMHLWNVGLLQ
jgi:hypothetical protein